MNKVRIVGIGMAMALLCGCLTGCMGNVSEVKINKDGSGTFSSSVGFTRETIEGFQQTGGSTETPINEMYAFNLNGTTYYGEHEEDTFTSVEEFNQSINLGLNDSFNNGTSGTTQTTGRDAILLESDGEHFTLKINTDIDEYGKNSMEQNVSNNLHISQEEAEQVLSTMACVLKFEFPADVYQLTGFKDGITVERNKITLDMIKIGSNLKEDTVFTFSTNPIPVTSSYSDVANSHWAYGPIHWATAMKLVSGIGNGQFSPDSNLTYAQFAQIFARKLLLPTGADENGYWAGKAIRSCIDYGALQNMGAIIPQNYDVPMSREAAISAMAFVYKVEDPNFEYTISEDDIPDFYTVSPEYRQGVLNAYNIGITAGVDSNRTFSPHSILTRAQLCQLLYNIDN